MTGTGVTIGILESGNNTATHEDLPRIDRGWQSYLPDDHATHVAGLACARDNSEGVIGVAYGYNLQSRALDDAVPIKTYLPVALNLLKALIRSGATVATTPGESPPTAAPVRATTSWTG